MTLPRLSNVRAFVSLAFAAALSVPVAAQWINYKTPGVPRLPDGRPNLSAPAPKTPEGKPDLSGIWQAGRAGQYGYDYDVTQTLKPEDVQPWARALRFKRAQDFRKDSPLAHCMPVSVPFLNFRGLSRIVQTPQLIVILYESPNSPHRTIFMDGRELPKDPNPSFMGYSVGRWDGDTLVVDVTSQIDKTWFDRAGDFHSDELHVVERISAASPDLLNYEATIEDKNTFSKPWKITMPIYRRKEKNAQIMEFKCVEFVEELIYGNLRKPGTQPPPHN